MENNISGKCYFDLCIQESFFNQENLEECIKHLYSYGYRTIAVNQLIDDEQIEPKKKKKKGEPRESNDVVPTPYNTEKIIGIAKQLGYEDFKVLTRLTISFATPDILHKITKSPNYKKFDIVASSPTTSQALSFTCSNLDADILTFDPEKKFNLRLNRKMYNQLVERNYFFELLYSPCIQDSTKRKNTIHMSHLYHTFGKAKNIIFSSGAESYMYIRSPYDIINLGILFGLNGTLKCRTAINEHPRKVILNSIGRRHGKAVMFVKNVNEDAEGDSEDINVPSEDEEMDVDEPKLKKTKV